MITEDCIRVDYLVYKTEVLRQLGLTDKAAVKAHLQRKSKDADTELKRKIQIDNVARTMLMNYYDGDRTYVKAKSERRN